MDTGIGRTAYSIMAQGQIDQILSSKPEERRAVFEEAAGITKFKREKKEALRKLEYTEANLLRVADIIAEVRTPDELAPAPGAKARRYQVLHNDLRVLDTHLGHRHFTEFQAEKSETETQIKVLACPVSGVAGKDPRPRGGRHPRRARPITRSRAGSTPCASRPRNCIRASRAPTAGSASTTSASRSSPAAFNATRRTPRPPATCSNASAANSPRPTNSLPRFTARSPPGSPRWKSTSSPTTPSFPSGCASRPTGARCGNPSAPSKARWPPRRPARKASPTR